jgi:hypothetical protein
MARGRPQGTCQRHSHVDRARRHRLSQKYQHTPDKAPITPKNDASRKVTASERTPPSSNLAKPDLGFHPRVMGGGVPGLHDHAPKGETAPTGVAEVGTDQSRAGLSSGDPAPPPEDRHEDNPHRPTSTTRRPERQRPRPRPYAPPPARPEQSSNTTLARSRRSGLHA